MRGPRVQSPPRSLQNPGQGRPALKFTISNRRQPCRRINALFIEPAGPGWSILMSLYSRLAVRIHHRARLSAVGSSEFVGVTTATSERKGFVTWREYSHVP